MALDPALSASPGPRRARVGLFGGSFDPVHVAHLALARCALEQLELDQLLWLPAGRPWQKTGRGLASPEHRRTMVALMLAGESRFVIDDSELERDGASYTIDTVRARQAAHPDEDLFLVIGQDQYERLHSWREWRELLQRVTLAVAARAGQEVRGSADVQMEPHSLLKLALPAMQVSSTQVRELASRGEDIRPLVGDAVAGYIAQHRLYSE
ncbi:nicotinate-nucleotide adenylyltransferase [Paucibacter sp. DJ2R-2]|uniref:nicotinate-nucleotide adenylyltransferase n=1 Tax=Paucibacter sp. DJ2R-2 TaxID=2893558 RepID=UPI0021E46E48|nr:nicotinate-nucleotide adenylyltransferase [Paucibacter sp. DJ2R-2]MCV2423360.1 nicotinate-nucleotide adenylyltransferase [Paucibacter sp. DJ4R-1]MCV2438555.1 nicotinate-nucleotide adenylyltransferase [Paucibacter sp. DJ2R-2]